MLAIRKSLDRGFADHGWLKSFHTFSFAGYYDPAHMGWGNLRVINEDRIAPGTGFGTHAHRDMEIISYVISGELAHRDDMGHGEAIKPGDIQRMTAGRGVRHSEFNHAQGETTHFLQIWIEPSERNIDPGYEQKHFSAAEKQGRPCLLASPDGRDGSVTLHADASIYGALLDGTDSITLPLAKDRKAYVQVIRGSLQVNGLRLEAGDALKVEQENQLELSAAENAEVLIFDLAPH